MKRNGKVINARQAKAGRSLLRWAASGMNWAAGEPTERLKSQARGLLARGPAYAAHVARAIALVETPTQSSVTAIVRAAAQNCAAEAAEWEHSADRRDNDRHWNASWTYDVETASYRQIAAAIRAVVLA